MTSERIQRQIDRLRDEAEDASVHRDWETVRDRAQHALTFDPENPDALGFLAAAERALGDASAPSPEATVTTEVPKPPSEPLPTFFKDGRYAVKKGLGEGGMKKVYLVNDTLLDREVAFALIKTEGLDEVGRQGVTIVFANGMVWQEGKRANWRAIFFDNLSHWRYTDEYECRSGKDRGTTGKGMDTGSAVGRARRSPYDSPTLADGGSLS